MFWIFTESQVNTRHINDFHKGQFLEMLRILQNVILVKIPSTMNVFLELFDVVLESISPKQIKLAISFKSH